MVMDQRTVSSFDRLSEELLVSTREYAQLIVELMQEESQAVLAELERMENILGDAAIQLRDSFTGIDDLVSRELDSRSYDSDPESAPGEAPAQSIKERLAGQYRNSIMALQFEDIVMQMIGHSKSRANGMGKILLEASQNLAQLNSGDRDAEKLLRSIQASRQAIERFRGDRILNNPVNQGSLESGDIELF